MKPQQSLVFISYSSKDEEFVLKLATSLQSRHLNIWLDKWNITGHLPFWDEVQEAIEQCSHFIFVVSPHSLARGSAPLLELYHAASLRPVPLIIPVVAQRAEKLPIVISAGIYQFHDFVNQPYEKALAGVIEALHSNLPTQGQLPRSGEQLELSQTVRNVAQVIRSNHGKMYSKLVNETDFGAATTETLVEYGDRVEVLISKEQSGKLNREPARSIEQYLVSLIADPEFGPWDAQYVPLAGVVPRPVFPENWQGRIPIAFSLLRRQGDGPERRIVRIPIDNIELVAEDYSQFVILGEPGAGKTTILQKLVLGSAKTCLVDPMNPIPLFARLNLFRGDLTPREFLKHRWDSKLGRIANLPSFDRVLEEGNVILFLDGLNEMPRIQHVESFSLWREFLAEFPLTRCVFTCRTLDYINPLQIQQVEVVPLDDQRIVRFLSAYIGTQAQNLWDQIQHSKLLDIVRSPFLLTALAWIYANDDDHLPMRRGELLNLFVTALIEREKMKNAHQWSNEKYFLESLERLAWSLQSKGEGTSISVKLAVREILPSDTDSQVQDQQVPPQEIMRLAKATTLLQESSDGYIRFQHHLFQELFAARFLVEMFEGGSEHEMAHLGELWKVPSLVEEQWLNNAQDEWNPLPPLPSSGWEETAIIASSIMDDAASLIRQIGDVNPVLAGRCLNEGQAKVHAADYERIKSTLLEMLTSDTAHLRIRLAAGRVLASLGDPRFPVVLTQSNISYVKPPQVFVTGGDYFVGATRDDRLAREDEFPRHQVTLNGFWMNAFPTTIGEYRCFVEAGGYRDEQWWQSDASLRWLRGDAIPDGAIAGMLRNRQMLLESNRPLTYWAAFYGWRRKTFEFWSNLVSITEDEARGGLEQIYQERNKSQPAYWQDDNFNELNQPVVGVTWIEAQAYCAWLSSVSGRVYRLPTEPEWEVAVRLNSTSIYPWGNDFVAAFANTVEGRVLRPSPVGIYAKDASNAGVLDAVGNVREWTSSRYARYPYDDVRHLRGQTNEGEMVVRSGAWTRSSVVVRCTFRDHFGIDFYDLNLGFRLVAM